MLLQAAADLALRHEKTRGEARRVQIFSGYRLMARIVLHLLRFVKKKILSGVILLGISLEEPLLGQLNRRFSWFATAIRAV